MHRQRVDVVGRANTPCDKTAPSNRDYLFAVPTAVVSMLSPLSWTRNDLAMLESKAISSLRLHCGKGRRLEQGYEWTGRYLPCVCVFPGEGIVQEEILSTRGRGRREG